MIPQAVQCVVIGSVFNLVLLRENGLRDLARDLDGKVFRVHVRDIGLLFYLLFEDGLVRVHPEHRENVDVRISADSEGFARMLFEQEDVDDLVFRQLLRVSGDSESMLRFKKLMQAADIDWERELRAAFGDFFGRRVASAARALVATEQRMREGVQQSLQQGLRRMDVPDQQRLQNWQAGVEHGQHRIRRLEQRILRLEHRLQALQHSSEE